MKEIINIDNIKQISEENNPVIYRYAFNGSKWRRFELMQSITIALPKGTLIIPKGFLWDLSSVPSWLWWLMKPFGKFDIAYLVHDYLYQNKGIVQNAIYTRKECDDIMLDYAKAIMKTDKISFRNIDVYIRYYNVRAFGSIVWNKKENTKSN